MKKFFSWMFLALCICIMGVMSGCGGQQEKQAEPQPKQKLVIGLMPDVDSIPFVIAAEKGYFKDEGIEVELQPYKSAMDRDSALQSGNLDGVVSDVLAAAFAKSGGFDVKITSFTDGSYSFVAGKDETASDIGGFAGKKVAVSKNTIIEYVTDRMLGKAGIPEDSIEKVVIPQIPTRLEMLQNGKLPAATLPEPMASIAVSNGCRMIASSDELGINPGILLFTEKAIKEKGEGIKAMYRAYDRAAKYLNEAERKEYIDVVVDKGGLPPAAKEALPLPKYHEATLPKKSDIEECIAWMNQKGLIKETYSYEDLVESVLP